MSITIEKALTRTAPTVDRRSWLRWGAVTFLAVEIVHFTVGVFEVARPPTTTKIEWRWTSSKISCIRRRDGRRHHGAGVWDSRPLGSQTVPTRTEPGRNHIARRRAARDRRLRRLLHLGTDTHRAGRSAARTSRFNPSARRSRRPGTCPGRRADRTGQPRLQPPQCWRTRFVTRRLPAVDAVVTAAAEVASEPLHRTRVPRPRGPYQAINPAAAFGDPHRS